MGRTQFWKIEVPDMIQFHIYPGGRRKILTFSYDDGKAEDVRLVGLFNKYGVKATFNLNSGVFLPLTEEKIRSIRELYAGHEIAGHTLLHGWPIRIPLQSLTQEYLEDRKYLEMIAERPVVGSAYPCGSYSDEVDHVLRACGVVYSRTVDDTHRFLLPKDFLRWHPTCHHREALSLVDNFLENLDYEWSHPLFYVWGHSFEFRTEAEWADMELFLQKISGNPKIWYATNLEIYDYMTAQRMLQISVDETIFRNPTAIDVWVEKNKRQIIHIPAGETVRI